MREITSLVIHHSASNRDISISEIRKWHVEGRGWDDIGYHYVTHEDGSVHIGRPIHLMGAHALGFNENSIGICVTGNNLIPEESWTFMQILSLHDLCAAWRKIIPRISIFGHKEVGNTHTVCPGIDLNKILPREWF